MFGTAHCPYCGHPMSGVFYTIAGAVRFCHARDAMEIHISQSRPDIKVTRPERTSVAGSAEQDRRLHTVVGQSGFLRGTWPKEGFYCDNCGTMTVRLKPD